MKPGSPLWNHGVGGGEGCSSVAGAVVRASDSQAGSMIYSSPPNSLTCKRGHPTPPQTAIDTESQVLSPGWGLAITAGQLLIHKAVPGILLASQNPSGSPSFSD